jgi:hypothetical protein
MCSQRTYLCDVCMYVFMGDMWSGCTCLRNNTYVCIYMNVYPYVYIFVGALSVRTINHISIYGIYSVCTMDI